MEVKSERKKHLDLNRRKTQDNVWLIVRCIVFAAVLFIMFTSRDLYAPQTGTGFLPPALRVICVLLLSVCCAAGPWIFPLEWPEQFRRIFIILIYLAIIPVVLFLTLYMCEHIHGYDLLDMRKKFIFFNGVLAFGIFLIFHMICNRVKWSLMLTYVLIVAASSVNYYVNIFRGEAVNAADVFTIGTALNVAGEYSFSITLNIFHCMLAGAVLLTLFTWMPAERSLLHKWFRLGYVVLGSVFVISVTWLFTCSKWPIRQDVKVRVFDPMRTYKKNGELLNFVRGFYYVLVDKPKGYSTAACENLMDSLGYESDAAQSGDVQDMPNIIYIMNESLTDFSVFDHLALSEDPLPYIHSLKGQDNAIIGRLHVDVFGGRTANTEYEVLTGNSMAFMPQNAVPYAMFVRKPQPSLVWNMRDIGYSGDEAFHPYLANGYSRPRAYPNLGFSRFVALDDIEDTLQPEDYLRNFVSDSADFRYICRLYEEAKQKSSTPYFQFNVTMQNHGSYTSDFENFEQDIEIGGEAFQDVKNLSDSKRFINLTQYSDEAFQELTEYFSKVEEPTILIMFGDHLPNFHNGFYKKLWGKSDTKLVGIERMPRFTTPLVIWANYDINADGKYDEVFDDISVNYLSADIMELAGLPMTAYQKYLVDMQKEIPVFTSHGMLDRDGNFYKKDDETTPLAEWVQNYKYLEYNYQFDKNNRKDAFFTLETSDSSLEAYQSGNGG